MKIVYPLLLTCILSNYTFAVTGSPFEGKWSGRGTDHNIVTLVNVNIDKNGKGTFEEDISILARVTGNISIQDDGNFKVDHIQINHMNANNYSVQAGYPVSVKGAGDPVTAEGKAVNNGNGHIIIKEAAEYDKDGDIVGHFSCDLTQ